MKQSHIATLFVVCFVAWTVVFIEREAAHSKQSLETFPQGADRRGYFTSHQGGPAIKTRWWPPKGYLKAVLFLVSLLLSDFIVLYIQTPSEHNCFFTGIPLINS